jgi:hypothetical protein
MEKTFEQKRQDTAMQGKRRYRLLTGHDREIILRECLLNGTSFARLAELFEVNPTTIRNVVQGKTSPPSARIHSGGRKPVLTELEVAVAARYLCMKPEARMHVVDYVESKSHKTVKLKGKSGFKPSDFRAIPLRRNSAIAKDQRAAFADEMIARELELALRKCLHSGRIRLLTKVVCLR